MKKITKLFSLLLALLMITGLFGGCSVSDASELLNMAMDVAEIVEDIQSAPAGERPAPAETTAPAESGKTAPDRDASYTSAEDVALYLHSYGCLPPNFITKEEARRAGWEGGSLEPYCPGKCIGGDRFGNREGLLPDAKGRSWTECDINTLGAKSRGAERLVFSNDGLIYYTADHYESFTLLYGTP